MVLFLVLIFILNMELPPKLKISISNLILFILDSIRECKNNWLKKVKKSNLQTYDYFQSIKYNLINILLAVLTLIYIYI